MPFGDILSNFKEIYLETADGQEFELENNFINKLAFKIIGIPHVEMRERSRKIFSLFPKKGQNKKVLDAGCGFGIYSLTLEKKGFDVYAIDISKKRIGCLKDNSAKVKAFEGDVQNLPFDKEKFDYVVSSEVIEHIKNDKKAVKEMVRVLKKGGSLILTVPAYSKHHMKNYKKYGHERIGYKIKDMEEFAKENNLTIAKIKPCSGKITEQAFKINEKLYKSKILLGALFYFLYFPSFMEGWFGLNKKKFNGIAIKFIKN